MAVRVDEQKSSWEPRAAAPVLIQDGGGLLSTADWLAPRESSDVLGGLRRACLKLASSWKLVPWLLEHVRCKSEAALQGVREHQPFLL